MIYHSSRDGGAEDDTAGLQQAIDSLAGDEFLTIRGVYKVTALFLRHDLILHLPRDPGWWGKQTVPPFPS